jgi:ubiquitin carboxyl-terminal hydrolase L5
LLTSPSKPVYGLIFLFKYRDEEEEEVRDVGKCPNHVWFANQVGQRSGLSEDYTNKTQTTNNACATIALLNIVMNVPEIDLGSSISSFKTATQRLKPAYRGQRLSGDDFIRNVHNSFAR